MARDSIEELKNIATRDLNIKNLETGGLDDFYNVSVYSIREALINAYAQGMVHGALHLK
jgi:hypothetical protein